MMDCMCTMNTGWIMDCMWPMNMDGMDGTANNCVILDIEMKIMVWMNKGLVFRRWDNGWNGE